jgi:glucan phosphorylase
MKAAVNLPDNADYDRSLTDFPYGGDMRYRLRQEVVLSTSGVRTLICKKRLVFGKNCAAPRSSFRDGQP